MKWLGCDRSFQPCLGDNDETHLIPMFEKKDRPAWLNWLFLGIFLFSSWQIAGFWIEKLHG